MKDVPLELEGRPSPPVHSSNGSYTTLGLIILVFLILVQFAAVHGEEMGGEQWEPDWGVDGQQVRHFRRRRRDDSSSRTSGGRAIGMSQSERIPFRAIQAGRELPEAPDEGVQLPGTASWIQSHSLSHGRVSFARPFPHPLSPRAYL